MSADVAIRGEMDGPTRRLLGGVGASFVVWGLAGALGWLFAAQACADGTLAWGALPGLGVRVLIAAAPGAALVVTIGTALAGWRAWRHTGSDEPTDFEGTDRLRFVGLAAGFVGITLSLGLLWDLLPAFIVDLCGFTR